MWSDQSYPIQNDIIVCWDYRVPSGVVSKSKTNERSYQTNTVLETIMTGENLGTTDLHSKLYTEMSTRSSSFLFHLVRAQEFWRGAFTVCSRGVRVVTDRLVYRFRLRFSRPFNWTVHGPFPFSVVCLELCTLGVLRCSVLSVSTNKDIIYPCGCCLSGGTISISWTHRTETRFKRKVV